MPREGDHRDVFALAHQIRFAERHGVSVLRHFALARIERLVFEEDHRVVVADRLNEKALAS